MDSYTLYTCNFRWILDYTLCRLDSMGYYEILLIKLWIWWGWGTLMVFVELVWFWERFDPLPDLLWILGISTWHRDIYRLSMEYCQMLHKHQVKRTCWASHAGTNWLQCCNKRGHLTHAIEVDNRLFFSLFHVYSSPKYIDRTVICHHFGGILLLFFFWGGVARTLWERVPGVLFVDHDM